MYAITAWDSSATHTSQLSPARAAEWSVTAQQPHSRRTKRLFQRRPRRLPPKAAPPPANLKYLSPRCASLSDAIRMGPTNGLKYDTINQMRREYSQECSESEGEASALVAQERRDKKDQLTHVKNAEVLNKKRSLVHQQQCGESKRILFNKRARTDLTDG